MFNVGKEITFYIFKKHTLNMTSFKKELEIRTDVYATGLVLLKIDSLKILQIFGKLLERPVICSHFPPKRCCSSFTF